MAKNVRPLSWRDAISFVLGLVVAWSLAGRHGYHGDWLGFAIGVTVALALIAIWRGFRFRNPD